MCVCSLAFQCLGALSGKANSCSGVCLPAAGRCTVSCDSSIMFNNVQNIRAAKANPRSCGTGIAVRCFACFWLKSSGPGASALWESLSTQEPVREALRAPPACLLGTAAFCWRWSRCLVCGSCSTLTTCRRAAACYWFFRSPQWFIILPFPLPVLLEHSGSPMKCWLGLWPCLKSKTEMVLQCPGKKMVFFSIFSSVFVVVVVWLFFSCAKKEKKKAFLSFTSPVDL